MKRQPEFLPAAGVRARIGGRPYVYLHTTGLGATLGDLGARVGLSPGTILDAILSEHATLKVAHAAAIHAIYESDAFRAEWDPSDEELATTLEERREALRAKRSTIRAFAFKNKERKHFEHMLAWPNPNCVLALPLSSNFAKVLEQSDRYRATAPNAKALDTMVDELDLALDRLSGALQDIDVVARRNHGEVSGLIAIAAVADVLIDHADADEITNLQRFKVFIEESMLPVASRRLLIDPEDFTPACAVRDDAAKKVLALLERADFIAEIRVVVENRDVVDPYVYDRVYMHLERAAVLLMRTRFADHFVEQEVMPAMRTFARIRGKPVDRFLATIPDADARAFFDDGWTAELPVGDSALAAALVANNILINTVTNVEGPMALGVAVFAIAAPRILQRFADNPLGYSGHRILSASVVRMLVGFGEGTTLDKLHFGKVLAVASTLPAKERVPHVLKTYGLTLNEIGDLKYKSAGRRGLSALLLMIALFGTVGTVEQSETLEDAAISTLQVLGAAGNTALGVADLAPVARVLEQRLGEDLLKLSTKQLATFVAFAGMAVSVLQVIDDVDRGDDFAAWMSGGNAAGTGLALGMWLLGRAAASPTVLLWSSAGAAVAAVALIAIGIAQIVDIIRSLSGPEAFIGGIIAHISRDDSAVRKAAMVESLELLRSLQDKAHFFRFPETARTTLRERGFGDKALRCLMAD